LTVNAFNRFQAVLGGSFKMPPLGRNTLFSKNGISWLDIGVPIMISSAIIVDTRSSSF